MKTGKQLASVGKQLASGRQNPGAGSGNLRGEHTRRIRDVRRWGICSLRIAENLRPRAAEVQNYCRYGNCSFSPSFPALAPSPSPRYGGVEPGSKSGPPPSFPNDTIGNPAALGLGSINSVIAIIQRHWIPDLSTRGRRYIKAFHSQPEGSFSKFSSGRRTRIHREFIPRKFPDPALVPSQPFDYCLTIV